MPIDWDAVLEKREQEEREMLEQMRDAKRERRAAYLADAERIVREQPEAVEIALKLLRSRPDHAEKIKAAAEVADLEKLKQWERTAHFAYMKFE